MNAAGPPRLRKINPARPPAVRCLPASVRFLLASQAHTAGLVLLPLSPQTPCQNQMCADAWAHPDGQRHTETRQFTREHHPTETHTVKCTRTHGCSWTLGEASTAWHLRSDKPGTCATPDPWLMVTHPHSWGHACTWLPNQKASVCSWIYLLLEA